MNTPTHPPKKPKRSVRFFSFLIFALILTALSPLNSCQSKSTYADDVPCRDLTDAAEQEISVDLGYESFPASYVRSYFGEEDFYDDACLRFSVLAEDVNELGIFHSKNQEDAARARELANAYLALLREERAAFLASYEPREQEKLAKAEVRQYGNYTVWAILSEDACERVFDTIEKRLLREAS